MYLQNRKENIDGTKSNVFATSFQQILNINYFVVPDLVK